MNIKLIAFTSIALLALATAGCEKEPGRYQKLSDTMVCGQSTFTVSSTCIESAEEMALNQCKPQELRVKNSAGERKAALPEMPGETVAAIRKAGRDPATLFVTEFGCTASQGANVAVLYYSAGAAPAPYSEVWVEYHEDGIMRGRSEPKLTDEARAALDRNMLHVRSIMPGDLVAK